MHGSSWGIRGAEYKLYNWERSWILWSPKGRKHSCRTCAEVSDAPLRACQRVEASILSKVHPSFLAVAPSHPLCIPITQFVFNKTFGREHALHRLERWALKTVISWGNLGPRRFFPMNCTFSTRTIYLCHQTIFHNTRSETDVLNLTYWHPRVILLMYQ